MPAAQAGTFDGSPKKSKVTQRKSICKKHSVEVTTNQRSPTVLKQVKLPALNGGADSHGNGNGKPIMKLDPTRLTPSSKLLTKRQQKAFYQAFQFFDHKRNGRISYEEFIETLRRVGVTVNEKAVYDLIVAQDENENGEMDFEEYLNFMTNEDIFMSMMGAGITQQSSKPDDKDFLMYQVLSKFIKKSVLEETQRMEIVGYYTRKLKKVAKKHILMHAAHVVHHYADGARSLGLTEKEIFNQIESIKQQNEGDEMKKNSPYARPIQLILTATKTNKTGRHIIKQPGWNTRQISAYGVRLPRIDITESKTFENVHDIRKKVDAVKEDYYWNLSKAQKKNFDELWKDLHISNISTTRLKTMMKGVFGTYTASRLTGCRGRHAPKRNLPDNKPIVFGTGQQFASAATKKHPILSSAN